MSLHKDEVMFSGGTSQGGGLAAEEADAVCEEAEDQPSRRLRGRHKSVYATEDCFLFKLTVPKPNWLQTELNENWKGGGQEKHVKKHNKDLKASMPVSFNWRITKKYSALFSGRGNIEKRPQLADKMV